MYTIPVIIYVFVTTEFKINIIVDGKLGGCHDKQGIKTRMISYFAEIIMCR